MARRLTTPTPRPSPSIWRRTTAPEEPGPNERGPPPLAGAFFVDQSQRQLAVIRLCCGERKRDRVRSNRGHTILRRGHPMRLKVAAVAIALIGALGLLAAPADAAPKKKARVVCTRGDAVYVSCE